MWFVKASLVNIESGLNGYNLNLLDNIVRFTGISLKDLSDEKFSSKDNFRELLLDEHKNNDKFHTILNQKPNIVYAINKKILKGSFLDQPKEIREIRDYLHELGWTYNGVSISVAIKRMQDKIRIEPHPIKKGTFLYSKK